MRTRGISLMDDLKLSGMTLAENQVLLKEKNYDSVDQGKVHDLAFRFVPTVCRSLRCVPAHVDCHHG